jgi:NADH-quinone oxidoreductase subunit G
MFATMSDLAAAPAFLLIGNDATEQNPFVAWQIRTAIRQHGARLYVVDSREHKLHRKSRQYLVVPAGQEPAAVAALAGADGANRLDAGLAAELGAMQEALARESDLIVLFGAVLQGRAMSSLAALAERRAAEGKRTRFMALGDYANSRGAADMGLLPEQLPGYTGVADSTAREAFGALWGAPLPEKPGLSAGAMLEAAGSGQLKALYVVGANPAKFLGLGDPERLGKLDVLIVHEMYLTETARRADIVLPALSAYEKDGTMTNTAGEIQLLRKGGDTMGPRSDFDILRILSHQLARLGIGQPIRLRTPEAAFDEIRRHVRGYDVSWTGLLTGAAEPTAPAANGFVPKGSPAGTVYSNGDSLFTSGSLTRYCRMVQSLSEAEAKS